MRARTAPAPCSGSARPSGKPGWQGSTLAPSKNPVTQRWYHYQGQPGSAQRNRFPCRWSKSGVLTLISLVARVAPDKVPDHQVANKGSWPTLHALRPGAPLFSYGNPSGPTMTLGGAANRLAQGLLPSGQARTRRTGPTIRRAPQ